MSKITDIIPQKHSAKHCNIYLDGSFFCGLRIETILEYRLKVGLEIEKKDLEQMQLSSELTHCLDRAMTYLTNSSKTKKQVIDYLTKKGYTKPIIDAVILKLIDYKFIDDLSFAQRYADYSSGNKGKYLIKRQLLQKGIDEKTTLEVLDNIEEDSETAYKIAIKGLKGKEIDQKTLSNCYRRIISRGYSYDTANEVLERIKKEFCKDE